MWAWFPALAAAVLLTGCAPTLYSLDRATESYPLELHSRSAVDIQVFRDDTSITLVNSTAHGYHDFRLWINRRYTAPVAALPAGETITLSLWHFYDERGQRFNAGGLFRTAAPTPVRLVQIQTSDDAPLIGLIAIRAERFE